MSDSINKCQGCGERKLICCGYDESLNDFHEEHGQAPAWCKDCCPHKPEHLRDRELAKRTGSSSVMLPELEAEVKELIRHALVGYGLIDAAAEDE